MVCEESHVISVTEVNNIGLDNVTDFILETCLFVNLNFKKVTSEKIKKNV